MHNVPLNAEEVQLLGGFQSIESLVWVAVVGWVWTWSGMGGEGLEPPTYWV